MPTAKAKNSKSFFIYASLIFCLLSAVIIFAVCRYIYLQETTKIKEVMDSYTIEQMNYLTDSIQALKRDVQFLSKTPPVKSILRASKDINHIDPISLNSLEVWKERLKVIFSAYMGADSRVMQVRYIGAAENGKEIIRIDRSNGEIVDVAEEKLQSKGSRDYFIETSHLSQGDVYVSEINLNQEFGKVAIPHQAMIRVSTPIYDDDGQFFGEVIINVDVLSAIERIGRSTYKNNVLITTYLVNAEGDYLMHTDPAKTFGFDLGKRYIWTDDYIHVSGQTYKSKDGEQTFLLEQKSVYLDNKNSLRKISIIAISNLSQVYARVLLFALAGLLFCIVFFMLFIIIQIKISSGVERKSLKSALKMERRFHLIFESSQDGKVIVNSHGKILLANKRFLKIFGYSEEGIVGQSIAVLLPARYHKELGAAVEAYFDAPSTQTLGIEYNLCGLHKNGTEVPVEVSLSPIESDSEITVLVGVIDISERKKLEHQFRLVVEAAPNGMVVVNKEGNIELINEEIERMFGYHRSELLGQKIEKLVPQRHQQFHPKWLGDFFQHSKARPMGAGKDLYGLRKDGKEFPLSIGLRPIETPNGLKVLAAVVDLTERFAKDKALRKLTETLDRTSRISGVGGWEYNLVTGEIFWSDETFRIHDLPVSDSPPSVDEGISFFTPDAQPIIRKAVEDGIESGDGWDVVLPFITAKGRRIWARAVGTVEMEKNKPVKLLGTFQDVTERKNFIDELERSNKELHDFAYVASHDLRSPLRGIDQLASWLAEDLEGKVEPDDLDHLRLMRGRISRMERLLDDLLAYSRAGKEKSNVNLTDVKEMVQNAFEMSDVKQSFQLVCEGNFPTFETLNAPLEQIFRNLISNAIKHHDKGEGTIFVKSSKQRGFYQFEVADDGAGIPPQHAELAFAMFQTLRPRDEVEGSGMGLAIVKKTVESFGGTIELVDNKPRGARFIFTWPTKVEL